MKSIALVLVLVALHNVYPSYAMPGEHPTTEDDRWALKVLRVTPQGRDVPTGRQIVFQFNRAVVSIGKMDHEQENIPVSIRTALGCKWRWLNTSALACQLRESGAMKRATTYNVVMTPGVRTEDGATIGAAVERSYTTTRPRITYSRFVNFLMGNPIGRPHDVEIQREILMHALNHAVAATEAGEMLDLTYDWGERVMTILEMESGYSATAPDPKTGKQTT